MNNTRMIRALVIAVAAILVVTLIPAALAMAAGVGWTGGILIAMGTLSAAELISTTINENTESPS